MATVLTQSPRPADFLLSEAPGTLSREAVNLAANQTLAAGTVLGQITASGEYVPLNPAATDGSQTARAILLNPANVGATAAPGTVIARLAEVDGNLIVWPAGITAAQQATAIGQLAANYVIVR